jgi:hypothetical protein
LKSTTFYIFIFTSLSINQINPEKTIKPKESIKTAPRPIAERNPDILPIPTNPDMKEITDKKKTTSTKGNPNNLSSKSPRKNTQK